MGVYKDKKGKWFVSTRYKNWSGETKQKTKRGFLTKREALVWEREFLAKKEGSLDMTFSSFYEVYKNNLKSRLRKSTWLTKESIIESKVLPYFGDMRICDAYLISQAKKDNTVTITSPENLNIYNRMISTIKKLMGQ